MDHSYATAEMDAGSLAFQPLCGGAGQQFAERLACNQRIRTTAFGQQGILQYAQKYRATGVCRLAVESGYAQGRDKIGHHARMQAMAHVLHRCAFRCAEALPLPAGSNPQQREPRRPAPSARPQDGAQYIELRVAGG